MVTHRWWGNKFCKRTCKGAYLRELALGRDKIRRRYGFFSRGMGSGPMQPKRRPDRGLGAPLLRNRVTSISIQS
jgi:hypothetical protein